MASGKTLNAQNLEALGAGRLASLLLDLASGDAAIKRRLRLELAARESPSEAAREIRKRLATIARSRSFVEWERTKALADDLEMQRRAIVEHVAGTDPKEALALMWRLLDLASGIYRRCDDSSGVIAAVFADACDDMGPLAEAARPDPAALADQVFSAIQENHYGLLDDLIETLAQALGAGGLARLKTHVQALAETPVERPPEAERQIVGYGSGGTIYADEAEASNRAYTASLALRAIADAEGDVDSFIAQVGENAKGAPSVAVGIARRLVAAGRAEEALTALDRVDSQFGRDDPDWQEARLDVLEALGRMDEAQLFRWDAFARGLSPTHLRAYLKRLPDFDDIAAEAKALALAAEHPDMHLALDFLIHWRALDKAAALVVRRTAELDGNTYEVLAPAAEALAEKQPLAATVLWRKMIDFTLSAGKSTRYHHAARHLAQCASLAATIADFGDIAPHDDYLAQLRKTHGRKQSFWNPTH